jgi:hypothetical protein
MATRGLQPLLNCEAFSSRRLSVDSHTTAACYLVRALTPCGSVHDFLWMMSRRSEAEPWMTDAIMAAEHGLLGFLHMDQAAAATTSVSAMTMSQ